MKITIQTTDLVHIYFPDMSSATKFIKAQSGQIANSSLWTFRHKKDGTVKATCEPACYLDINIDDK